MLPIGRHTLLLHNSIPVKGDLSNRSLLWMGSMIVLPSQLRIGEMEKTAGSNGYGH
jgi:hypothetical protein